MRMISENIGGNIHDTVNLLNRFGIVHYVFSIHDVTPNQCIVVFKFEDYLGYMGWCKKMHKQPMTQDDFWYELYQP